MQSASYFCWISMKLELSRQISKNTQTLNFMKIRPEGAESPHADGRTDGRTDGRADGHDEANSPCSQFYESAKKIPCPRFEYITKPEDIHNFYKSKSKFSSFELNRFRFRQYDNFKLSNVRVDEYWRTSVTKATSTNDVKRSDRAD